MGRAKGGVEPQADSILSRIPRIPQKEKYNEVIFTQKLGRLDHFLIISLIGTKFTENTLYFYTVIKREMH